VSGYILSPDADQDLTDIWDYIAADSIDAADRWIEKLFDAFESLAQHPSLGTSGRTSHRTRFCFGRLDPT